MLVLISVSVDFFIDLFTDIVWLFSLSLRHPDHIDFMQLVLNLVAFLLFFVEVL